MMIPSRVEFYASLWLTARRTLTLGVEFASCLRNVHFDLHTKRHYKSTKMTIIWRQWPTHVVRLDFITNCSVSKSESYQRQCCPINSGAFEGIYLDDQTHHSA